MLCHSLSQCVMVISPVGMADISVRVCIRLQILHSGAGNSDELGVLLALFLAPPLPDVDILNKAPRQFVESICADYSANSLENGSMNAEHSFFNVRRKKDKPELEMRRM